MFTMNFDADTCGGINRDAKGRFVRGNSYRIKPAYRIAEGGEVLGLVTFPNAKLYRGNFLANNRNGIVKLDSPILPKTSAPKLPANLLGGVSTLLVSLVCVIALLLCEFSQNDYRGGFFAAVTIGFAALFLRFANDETSYLPSYYRNAKG